MKRLLFILLFTLFFSGCTRVQTDNVPLSTLKPSTSSPFVPATPKNTEVRILFGGDLMFDRSIRQTMQKHGDAYILGPLDGIFKEYDVVVANLEGPVTSYPSKSVGSAIGSRNNYLFTFSPEVADLLKEKNISIVNIGNNHISNFGKEGVSQTRSYLQQAGVSYFGNTGEEGEKRFKVVQMHGMRIGFVNYNEFVPDGFSAALEDIDEVSRQADVVILYAHWGTEYVTKAVGVIEDQAHQFVDRGADLVIGSHPHVVQQREVYAGKIIYYSLGNFVFDQYFQQETQQGLLVGVRIQQGSYTVETTEIPIILKPNGQTMLKE